MWKDSKHPAEQSKEYEPTREHYMQHSTNRYIESEHAQRYIETPNTLFKIYAMQALSSPVSRRLGYTDHPNSKR